MISMLRRMLVSITAAVTLCACVDDDNVLRGHQSTVSSVRFSPDGKWLASGGWDTQLVLWDVASRRRVKSLHGHDDRVVGVEFLSNDTLISADAGGQILFWSRAQAKPFKSLRNPTYIQQIALMADNKRLVVKGGDTITVWDLGEGAVIAQTRSEHIFPRSPLVITPQGRVVFITGSLGDPTRGIGIWDPATGQFEGEIQGDVSWPRALAVTPRGSWLAVGGLDNAIWDLATGQRLQSFLPDCRGFRALRFTDNGKLLIAATGKVELNFIDAANGTSLFTLTGHDGPITDIALAPDGKLAASASQDQTVRLWSWQSQVQDPALLAPAQDAVQPIRIPAPQQQALRALYRATNGARWDSHLGWSEEGPRSCAAFGLTCDAQGNVVALRLGSNGLAGELPEQLGDLEALRELYLSNNQLQGPVPASLGRLRRLERLVLMGNPLDGQLPPELGGLTALQELHISATQISGPIPPELGQLRRLEKLSLWSNRLQGGIPPALGRLAALRELHLGDNALSGPVPLELAQLKKIHSIHLQGNALSGELPAEFARLPFLEILNVRGNPLNPKLAPALEKRGVVRMGPLEP